MNKVQVVGLALLLSLFGAGCAAERSEPSSASAAPPLAVQAGAAAAVAEPAGGVGGGGAPRAVGRALVVTMDLGITAGDVDEARATIRGEVERAGGYVADASSSGGSGERRVRMQLRVPSDKVQGIRGTLGRAFEITSEVEKVQDVTEERADLDARLHNARISEKRVLEIMATKAGAIHDVIEAEKEVSRIRESIERMEAQKRSLDGRIDLATVNVTISDRPALAAWQTPGKSIAGAARGGVRAAAATGVYGAMAFVAAAPILVPIFALVLGLIFALRSRRRPGAVSG